MPHRTEVVVSSLTVDLDQILDRAAQLQLDQVLFMREMENFRVRLEKVESSFEAGRKCKFNEFLSKK